MFPDQFSVLSALRRLILPLGTLATAAFGFCNAPGVAPGASWPLQAWRSLQLLLPGLCNAPAMLPDEISTCPVFLAPQICILLLISEKVF